MRDNGVGIGTYALAAFCMSGIVPALAVAALMTLLGLD